MRITISGLPGSGTTTVARLLAKELSLEIISAGELFRALARDKRLVLEEFSKVAEDTDEFDRWVDAKQREEAMKREHVIVEGRLSGFLVPEADLKVWLKAPLEVRAKRVAGRENLPYDEALAAMEAREQSEQRRYEEYYGINLADLSLYDLVIDTARWREHDIVALLLQAKERLKS
jgi:cytidylate kinase